jgi:hypothetical protein
LKPTYLTDQDVLKVRAKQVPLNFKDLLLTVIEAKKTIHLGHKVSLSNDEVKGQLDRNNKVIKGGFARVEFKNTLYEGYFEDGGNITTGFFTRIYSDSSVFTGWMVNNFR